MKALLIGEYREGKLLDNIYELIAFAGELGVDTAIVLVGNAAHVPRCNGTVYLADVAKAIDTVRH